MIDARITRKQGFTLIELSIVLVIVGLIVGGVLAGRDLIGSAAERAQITQIEKYNTAARAFHEKYDALPGDIADPDATSFGFVPRGGGAGGTGDGNGVIEGTFFGYYGGIYNCGVCTTTGETVVFWVDLSTAHMIDGGFNTASNIQQWAGASLSPKLYLPQAKISGNYVYVWSPGYAAYGNWNSYRINYFTVSGVTTINYVTNSGLNMTVKQTYGIDKKIDDGLPQSGTVVALYNDGVTFGSPFPDFGWAGTNVSGNTPYTTATAGSTTSCFDNSAAITGSPGVAGASQHYSTEMNNGNGVNCALSFQFK